MCVCVCVCVCVLQTRLQASLTPRHVQMHRTKSICHFRALAYAKHFNRRSGTRSLVYASPALTPKSQQFFALYVWVFREVIRDWESSSASSGLLRGVIGNLRSSWMLCSVVFRSYSATWYYYYFKCSRWVTTKTPIHSTSNSFLVKYVSRLVYIICIALVAATREIGLEVSADKTKYMVMSRDQNAGRIHSVRIDNSAFERVEEFKYFGTTLTNINSIAEEIKSRLRSGSACYHSVQNLLSSRLLSKNLKIKIYIEL